MSYNLPSRRLVSQDDHAMVARADVPRSKFSNRYGRLTTFNQGDIVPFLCEEVLPGDHLKYDVTPYCRMSTPIVPLMSNLRLDMFFFFVPYRILWGEWRRFMGEQADPAQPIDVIPPTVVLGPAAATWIVGSLYDHLGLPVGNVAVGQTIEVSSLPMRAYNRIYNEWFRDQNLQDSIPSPTATQVDNNADFILRQRAKSHDYFTSALPWPQKFTAPNVPVGGLAPVRGLAVSTQASTGVFNGWDTLGSVNYSQSRNAGIAVQMNAGATLPQVFADLSLATGVSINTLRQSFQIQYLLERDARGGTRYTEILRSHFGVMPPDYRLQRPEFIGGGHVPVVVTPVAQTVPVTSPASSVGTLGAAATATGRARASYAATEHGVILGLMNVRSELAYQQGLHRMWTRRTRYDYYWPALAHLGEQSILRQEIFCNGVDAEDTLVFGFQERWNEYRQPYSTVTGRFRSTVSGTLDFWHTAQRFTTAPVLGDTFIRDTPDMARILAAGSNAETQGIEFIADILIEREAVRPMPLFGTPTGLGRF